MKRRNLCVSKKLLAVILAASMSMNSGMIAMAGSDAVIKSVSNPVYESAPEYDSNKSEYNDVEKTVEGDATSDTSQPAVSVNSYGGYSADVTVEGTATATNKDGDATGVSASSYEDKNGSSSANNSSTSVTVEKEVSASSESGYATGISASSERGSTDVTAEKSVSGSSGSGEAIGISASSSSDGTTEVTAKDNVSASSGTGSATGIYATSYGGSTGVTAKGEVSASSNSGDAYGVNATSSEGGTTTVTAEKSVSATPNGTNSTNSTYAIQASSNGNGSTTTVTVTEDVTSYGATGILANAENGGTTKVNVGDDLTVSTLSNYAKGISTSASVWGSSDGDKTSVDVHVGGDVTVEKTSTESGSDYASAITTSSYGKNSAVNVAVDGDLTVTGLGAITATANGGTTNITVGGNIIQKGSEAATVSLSDGYESESNATITVTVAKDITATGDAVTIQKTSDDSTIDLLVEGTISGGDHAVVLNEVEKYNNNKWTVSQSSTENLNITVWKIESSNESGNLVEDSKWTVSKDTNTTDSSKSTKSYTRNEEAEKNINYIIKVDPIDPSIGGKFALSGTTISHGFETAHEGDKVYLEVTVPENYEIDSFYNAKGAANVSVISSGGKYYLEVPRGGGVYVGVNLKKIENNTPVTPSYSSSGYSSDYSDSDSDDHGFTVGNNNDSSVIGTTLPPEFVAFQIHATTFAGLDAAQNVSDVLTLIEPLLAFNIFVEAGIPTQGVQNVIGAGIVNFNNMFVDAITETVEVPVSANVKENQAYTVVFSDGTSIVVNCVMDGVLVIPFDKKAAGLTYMIYGTQLDPSAFIGTATADLTQ